MFFKHLDFSEKLARVSSVFRTFPNLQNLIKAFKNTYKLQFYTSILGLLVHNPINTIYIHIHLFTSNHQNIQTLLNSMHIFIKTIWAWAGLKPTAYVPRPLRIKAHIVPFQLYTYTYMHNKIFTMNNMQNYIYNEITVFVSSMARLTAQEGPLSSHLSWVLKMFLKPTEKNELKEPSECTFSFR